MGGAINGDKYHNILFQNPGHENSWVTVKLTGEKSNRAAIGARIRIVTAVPVPRTFYRHVSSGSSFGANPLQQTIGLGSRTESKRSKSPGRRRRRSITSRSTKRLPSRSSRRSIRSSSGRR